MQTIFYIIFNFLCLYYVQYVYLSLFGHIRAIRANWLNIIYLFQFFVLFLIIFVLGFCAIIFSIIMVLFLFVPLFLA